MRKVLFSLAAAAVLGFGFAVSPASAAPTGPVHVEKVDSSVLEVQTSRSQRMERRRMMRRNAMRRNMMRSGAMRGGDPNARNPSRPPSQQNLGQSSGGYR